MKVTYLRATAALALGLALAACGGKASFDVSGQIYTGNTPGITNGGMVLTNGSDTITVPTGATTFTFPTRISYGTDYNIQIKTPPDHMNCTIGNNSGSAGHTTSIQAIIQCTQNAHSLGGTVTGLISSDATTVGLVLTNGSTGGQVGPLFKAADGSPVAFTFLTPVFDGAAYGVAVFTQPAGLNCVVSNGTGIMHETDIINVAVACSPK